MSPTELLELIGREPFIPFTVFLADGKSFRVTQFENVDVSGMCLVIYDKDLVGQRVARFISIPNLLQVVFTAPGGAVPNDR